MSTVIQLENISKQYRLGTVGSGTLRGDVAKTWAKIRGKEDPTLQIGMENSLADATGDYVWALRDINLGVNQGEILGIIGKNGAGKSTLLKILSRVTAPTTGSIKVKGRIASLLEVGTGFHPELTGRENIYMNGAILGMRKVEISSKLDEIVDFAGVAKYLDTPIKRYSSGMYVRLGFAVAAHLEPEILIVDEVLAVGDAEFQKKAIGKMQDVSTNQGRTVLFVSHNMASVQRLCTSAIHMQRGMISNAGPINEVVENYLTTNLRASESDVFVLNRPSEYTLKVKIKDVSIVNANKVVTKALRYLEPLNIQLVLFANTDYNNLDVSVRIDTIREEPVCSMVSSDEGVSFDFIKNEEKVISLTSEGVRLTPGIYQLTVTLKSELAVIDRLENICVFEVTHTPYLSSKPHNGTWGKFYVETLWN